MNRVTVVDFSRKGRGREVERFIDADGIMLPSPPPRRGGVPRDKAKAKAARKARRRNR